MNNWYALSNAGEIPSPALVVYRTRIEENILQMLRMAGSPDRLRPHIKTHKIAELIRLQQGLGIQKFKCATIAEAELLADCNARDVLLAYPLVGPSVPRLITLQKSKPGTRFSTLMDDAAAAAAASAEAVRAGVRLEALVDLDIGQHRTGIAPEKAEELCQLINRLPGLRFGGLHAYDGHIHDHDPEQRARVCEAAFEPVKRLRARLESAGIPVARVVAGGTPTFPIHARRGDVECSPGTSIFWDAGYSSEMPDLQFQIAAVLLVRVVSKPAADRICLDLGHKAVASEMPQPRVVFPEIPDAIPVAHNEEHLVIQTSQASGFSVGDVIYAFPWHICPTVALHSEVWVAQNGRTSGTWPVPARARRLTC